MTTRDRKKLLQNLCSKSRSTSFDPFADVAWPEQLDPDGWCMSPELISLSGTELYASLTEPERRRLSFLEAVNFFSLNIHGERQLLQGLASDVRLVPLAREINRLHHLDEARHLAFGRLIVAETFERHAPEWSAETLAAVRKHLEDFIGASCREYFNPDVYRDAGFSEPYALRRIALQSPAACQRAAEAAHRCVRQLTNIGVFPLEVRHAS